MMNKRYSFLGQKLDLDDIISVLRGRAEHRKTEKITVEVLPVKSKELAWLFTAIVGQNGVSIVHTERVNKREGDTEDLYKAQLDINPLEIDTVALKTILLFQGYKNRTNEQPAITTSS